MVDTKEKQKFKKFKDLKDFNSYYLKHPPTTISSPKKIKKIKDPDLDYLKERKALKEKSIEEKLADVTISATEKKALDRVFELLSNKKEFIERLDIARILGKLGMKLTKSEIDLMIWVIQEILN